MRPLLTATISATFLLAACGGSDEAATTTPATAGSETTVAAETAAAPETTEPATVSTISRDAAVAVRRCLDEADLTLPLSIDLDGAAGADAAKEACDEAARQVEVDSTGDPGIAKLALSISDLNVVIAENAMWAAINGDLTDDEFATMMDKILTITTDIDAQLVAVS